jgi:hypothetical protein
MDEKTALEEIKFIRNVIEDSKKSVVYNGKDYIFWGVIVIVGMMSTYIFHMSHIYFNFFWIWVVIIPVGWIYSLYNRRVHKIKFPYTYAGKLFASIWGGAGIGMTILGFLGTYSGTINPMAISPILAIIMGGAYFISGTVVGVKWMSYLSFGWWIGGIILLYITSVNSFLIMSLLMLFFQTIPGILLYRKYKKEVELKL